MRRLGVVCGVLLSGCFTAWPAKPHDRGKVKLPSIADRKIESMGFGLSRNAATLCPGGESLAEVVAKVTFPGEPGLKTRGLGRAADTVHWNDVKVASPHVEKAQNGWLWPRLDVPATVESGFDLTFTYGPQPRFSETRHYKPSYECLTGWYADGQGGNGGQGGQNGGWGASGGSGTNGGNGEGGGDFEVVVTYAATPHYPKLILYLVQPGGHVLLAPPSQRLTFSARGGNGGHGGHGGDGGGGIDAAWEEENNVTRVTSAAGNGGSGGNGGIGGSGGRGGKISVSYDARFPELKQLIRTEVSGGSGGNAGGAGMGGAGGAGVVSNGKMIAPDGAPGGSGGNGGPGQGGQRGSAVVNAVNLPASFEAGLPKGISWLGRGR